jgi:mannose/fructose/sorbose-specific phosphotransferase system IID component
VEINSNKKDVKQVETTTTKIDKKDLRKVFWRSFNLQGAFNYERMQGLGFGWTMLPIINKLYKKKEDRAAAYKRHLSFFNTHPWTSGVILGMVTSMEERMANGEDAVDEESIQAVKGGLMGPLAGIGDSLFFSTLRPIIAGLAVSLALNGNYFAPLLFIIGINIIHFWVQWQGVFSGYKLADKFLEKMEGMQIQKWMEAAAILGLMVLGALVATWLNVQTPLVYTMEKATIPIQKMLDGILPKALPLLATLLVFRFIRKGKSATVVMGAIVVVGLVLGVLGIIK